MTPPLAILFDLDGTLTRPLLNFDAIRRDLAGICPTLRRGPILENLDRLPPDLRTRADAMLHRHERDAAEASTLNEGCHQVLEAVRRRRLPTGLVTRNSAQSTGIVLSLHGLTRCFDVLISRENRPYKPHPAALWQACDALGVGRRCVWHVGDGSHDLAAADGAGIPCVWLRHGQVTPPGGGRVWRTIDRLPDLLTLLDGCDRPAVSG